MLKIYIMYVKTFCKGTWKQVTVVSSGEGSGAGVYSGQLATDANLV